MGVFSLIVGILSIIALPLIFQLIQMWWSYSLDLAGLLGILLLVAIPVIALLCGIKAYKEDEGSAVAGIICCVIPLGVIIIYFLALIIFEPVYL